MSSPWPTKRRAYVTTSPKFAPTNSCSAREASDRPRANARRVRSSAPAARSSRAKRVNTCRSNRASASSAARRSLRRRRRSRVAASRAGRASAAAAFAARSSSRASCSDRVPSSESSSALRSSAEGKTCPARSSAATARIGPAAVRVPSMAWSASRSPASMRRESSTSSSCDSTRRRAGRTAAGDDTVASLAAVLPRVSRSSGSWVESSRRGARAVVGTFTMIGGWDAGNATRVALGKDNTRRCPGLPAESHTLSTPRAFAMPFSTQRPPQPWAEPGAPPTHGDLSETSSGVRPAGFSSATSGRRRRVATSVRRVGLGDGSRAARRAARDDEVPVAVLVGIAVTEGQLTCGLGSEELLEIGRVARIEQPEWRGAGERPVRVLNKSSRSGKPGRDAGRVGDHPVRVVDEPTPDEREVIVPEQVAGRLGHGRHLSLRAQVRDKAGVRPQMGVVEVEADVPHDPHGGVGRAGAAKAELDVREESAALGAGRRIDVRLRDVGDRSVRQQPEIPERDGLVSVDRQGREGEDDLARKLGLRLLLQVVGARVRLLEETFEVSAMLGELVGQPVAGQLVDRTHVTGGLERNRRDLGGIGEGGHRARQVAAPERIDDPSRQIARPERGDERLGHVDPGALVIAISAPELVAVPADDGGIESRRQRLRSVAPVRPGDRATGPTASGHAKQDARLVDEVLTRDRRFGRCVVRRRARTVRTGGRRPGRLRGGRDGGVARRDRTRGRRRGLGRRGGRRRRTWLARRALGRRRRGGASTRAGKGNEREQTSGHRAVSSGRARLRYAAYAANAAYAGTPVATIAKPTYAARAPLARTFQSTQAFTPTNRQGTMTPPGTRNARGASGRRTLSTTTAATVSVENATMAKVANVSSCSKLPVSSCASATADCSKRAASGTLVVACRRPSGAKNRPSAAIAW